MMNNARVQELINGMKSFSKETYHKSELLGEMLTLQDEIVKLTFNDDHSSTANLKIYDVEKHFEQLNKECGYVANEELRRFEGGSKVLCNLIKAEISGNRGEHMAFESLKALQSKNIILRNIELEDGDWRTEIDALVITPKCLTIIEVKNPNRNIFINEIGKYYRTGEYLKFDCDIVGKLALKETLLRKALSDSELDEIKIQKIVVFTNDKIEVRNKCSELRTCFLSQVVDYVDEYDGDDIFDEAEMYKIKSAVVAAERKEYYPSEFDATQYKMDFATVMAILEAASAEKEENREEIQEEAPEIYSNEFYADEENEEKAVNEEIHVDEEREEKTNSKKVSFKDAVKAVFSSKTAKYTGIALAGITLGVLPGVATLGIVKLYDSMQNKAVNE